MTDFEREERAFREALLTRADEVPIESVEAPESGPHRPWFAVAVAAAVVALVVGLSQVGRPGAPEEPDPAPASPTATGGRTATNDPTPPSDSTNPSKDPAGVLAVADPVDVAVTPGDVDSRAVAWSAGGRSVVAVTGDGFETRSLHDFRGWVSVDPLGDGRFAVASDRAPNKVWIVGSDGGSAAIQVDPARAPAADGEAVVAPDRPVEDDPIAVDPVRGIAHHIPLPVRGRGWTSFGGRIHTVIPAPSAEPADDADDPVTLEYHWSDDGGATWQSGSMVGDWLTIPEPLPTVAGTDHVVLRTSDGATLGPFGGSYTMPSAGGGFSFAEPEFSEGTQATFSDAFVHAGAPVVIATIWPEGGGGPPSDRGLYRVVGGSLDRVDTNIPEVMDTGPQVVGLETREGADSAVWVADHDGRLFRSEDGGETWQEMPGQ